jgi:LAS superfamily LD-carboxypeptidase LdcB
LLILIAGVSVWLLINRPDKKIADQSDKDATHGSQKDSEQLKDGDLKQFSGEEFKELARSIKYPNVHFFEEPPPITGDKAADDRIRSIAESRGYVMTSIPVNAIQKINEPNLLGDDLLQPQAAISWEELKQSAKAANIPLVMTSAYRSPAYQRDLFMERLTAKGATVAQIAAGGGDEAITLQKAAVPGYSRHHTGYTIDLWCEDGSAEFLASICFKWMSADNYLKAKETGWIPSYPEGAGLQGPEPEPWEYIWVGKENLVE